MDYNIHFAYLLSFQNCLHFILKYSLINSLPWDQYTGLGYFYEIIFDFISSSDYMLLNGLLCISFISLCLFHSTFYQMFRHSVQRLDRNENQNSEKLLSDLIHFHTTVKGYVRFEEFYQRINHTTLFFHEIHKLQVF